MAYITPLVINALGGEQTDRQTHTYRCTAHTPDLKIDATVVGTTLATTLAQS